MTSNECAVYSFRKAVKTNKNPNIPPFEAIGYN